MAVSTSYKKEVMHMKKEILSILLELVRLGIATSVTVTKNTVIIRIKK